MILQITLTLIAVVALVGVLLGLILFINRQRGAPQPQEQQRARYTPGEQEILERLESLRGALSDRLDELKERVEKFIPPYGRVGYVPSNASELAQLLGFKYVKLGQEVHGELPKEVERYLDIDAEVAQIKEGDYYVYIIKRGDRKLIAVGDVYLDYLTVKFLQDFLSYI